MPKKTEKVEKEELIDYEDGMTITVETYLNPVQIYIPAELCRNNYGQVIRLAAAMVELALKDYEEVAVTDGSDAY